MARFRAGCPRRPYARYARPGRPPACPCTWTDWIISQRLRALNNDDPDLTGRLRRLEALFPH